MTRRSKYGYQPVLSLIFALSVSACGPAPVSQPPASLTPASPNASGSPGVSPLVPPSADANSGNVTVHLQADASLAGFTTAQQSPLTLCLGQIARASNQVSFAGNLPDAAKSALTAKGATVSTTNGRTSVTVNRELSLQTLLAGLDIVLNGLPAGRFEGRTTFFNAAGAELGFISWQADVPGGNATVSVLLKASGDTRADVDCPRLGAEVSGGTILGAGGQIVNPNPLPNPVTTPSPSQTASPAANAPALPTGIAVVEQTATSLTLQWEFGSGPLSFNLYLDGRQVTSNYVSPNYYRFEGLSPSTAYTLGVQAVNSGGMSSIASLSSVTLNEGHSGSGNFSGGGGSRRSSPSPSPSPSTGPSPGFGNDFVINSYTTSRQYNADVAMDADGDFVVTWLSYGQDGSREAISAQRFASDGSPLGSEFSVNTYTTDFQEQPAVAMDADGDFVIVWQSYTQDTDRYGVFAQRYSSSGSPVGSEFQVNPYTTQNQERPDVAMDDAGDFVITWQSNNQDGDNRGVYAQLYAANGAILRSEFQVNTYSTNFQGFPSVAMAADGDFVITWQSDYQDGDFQGVFAQRFTSTGSRALSEFQVNAVTTGGQQSPKVAMDDAGDFVVTWRDFSNDGNNSGVFARRFSSNGSAAVSQFLVNTYTTNNQFDPAIAMDADG
ncbi:MAG: hypothetical protein ACAI44_32020, partial [Candidatus Sericytochromatia bacterium]